MGARGEEERDKFKEGESKNDCDFGARLKQVLGQAAPQMAKIKYTTSEGISQ